ncbi:glycoside hydrolase family protein [Paenibacillus sp. FSL R7-277]|uniref:family 16 glycoside hydrolase n=1 Tax=Paenibacillus sp. FSL R7-277 TaxID=1227352 RepID=UPI0003E285DB|nr:family 16 glycoside hydrolase [Paenibacillus sp. FSL R7-277]ETT77125.1 glycoside hydrolase family protein [Paenibacillus sp. FSL R7-277]
MLTHKVMRLLLVLAVAFAGFIPQTAGAAEPEPGTEPVQQVAAAGPATIQNYPMPSIYTPSSVYSLKVNNENVPVVKYLPDYDYAQFSFEGTISLEVTADKPITSYSISPLAKNITGTVNGNKLTFTLSASTYVIVDINTPANEDPNEKDPDKRRKRLVIAADPLETDIPASSGPGIYNVTAAPYNADKTGATITSGAIQQAIDAASQAGGGTVYIPAGVYKSSNLTLKSNVTFYLAGGAVIVGTGRGEDYRNDFRKDSISDGTYFIRTATNSVNITMRGRGTIDGKGIEMRKRKMTNPPATHKQGEGFINNLVVPMATSNFKFDGLTLRDGGFWAFLVVRSDNVTITNYKGYQDLFTLEDDAIDINESQNVLVKHALAISDDDTFSTKTWPQKGMSKDWPGAIEHLENVVFEDCFAWTRCAAFKLGMGICTPQIGVTIRNSYVYQSARALLVDHAYTENPLPVEGWAKDVTFENIDIERVGINQFGNYWLRVSTSTAGDVSNVILRNINVRETGGDSPIQGNPTRGGMVNGVTFENVVVKGTLAKNLSDLKVSIKNENVSGVVFANTDQAWFSDHFTSGLTTDWTMASGANSWAVTDQTGNRVLSTSQTTTALITAKAGAAWTDYTYEARARLPLINGSENAGIVFRVQDQNNFYMYRINAGTSQLELYKAVAGTLTQVSTTSFVPVKNQWYTLKATVQGNTIKGYVDGVLKTTWTNPVNELTSGGIGFRTTSAGVWYDDAKVTAIHNPPTDITFSATQVPELTTPGGLVGTFTTAHPDAGQTFTYALVPGQGDADNSSFSITPQGDRLILRTTPDYEAKSSYSIRVKSIDASGLSLEKSFTIQVTDVDETPIDANPNSVRFTDNFEDGNTTGWTAASGTWSVTTDGSTKALIQTKGNSTGLITAGDSWQDIAMEAKVKVPIANANAGILFRVQDANNYYMYRINVNDKKLELFKAVGGTLTPVSSTLFADAAAGQWYTLKAVIKGNRILGFVDGQLKLEWTNPQTELTAGKIGFRTTSQNAVFDNARVTGIHKVTANALKTVTQDVYEAVTPEGNRLSLSPGSPLAGETLTLTAEGHNQSLAPVAPGDERYYPEAWSSTEDGMAGVFTVTDEVYQAAYVPTAVGDYKITVIYRKQVWDGTAWADTELTDSLIVDIKVIPKPADAEGDSTTEQDPPVLG